MVDNTNPTSQFHPYVPQDATPQTGNTPSSMSGLGGILNKLNAGQQLKNVRGLAQNNGGLVLGGLAALAIGAGLMRKRSMSRG
jgi:hypothetical protein